MSNIEVKYDVLNQKATPAFFADIFANRPAAGFVGRVFISTDTYLIYRDNGTTWDLIGGTNTSPSGGNIYYFNGSVSSSVSGYEQMSTTAIVGTTSNFTLTGNGLICEFITDVNQPNTVLIPAGNWNFGTYLSMSSNGGTPQISAEIYLYNGSTFTLIGTSTPETITGGTLKDYYQFAAAVPYTTILATNRIAVRFVISNNAAGRVTTFYTQDNNISQVGTTLPAGLNVYVPYNGANNNVDINTNSLISSKLVVNGIGTIAPILTNNTNNVLVISSNPTYSDNTPRIEISGITETTSPNNINFRSARQIFTSSLAGTEYMRVENTGNLLINTSIDIGYKLQVVGSAWFNGNVIATGLNGAFSIYRRDTFVYAGGWYSLNGDITLDMPSIGTALNFTKVTGIATFSSDIYLLKTASLAELKIESTTTAGVLTRYKGNGTDIGYISSANVTVAGGSATDFAMIGTNNVLIGTGSAAGLKINNSNIGTFTSRLNVNNSTDNSNFQLNNSGGLLNTGGLSTQGLTFSTSTTADLIHSLYVFNGSTGQTLTLPLALGHNIVYYIKNNTVNTMSVTCSGANTIQTLTGTTPATITLLANAIIYLISNGTVNYIQII